MAVTATYHPSSDTLTLRADGVVKIVDVPTFCAIGSELQEIAIEAQRNPGKPIVIPNRQTVPRPLYSRVYGISQ